jgi:MFS family permease
MTEDSEVAESQLTDSQVAHEQPVRLNILFWLTVAQCLGSFGQITMATLSGIVGSTLSAAPELATLPVTTGIVGVAAAAWPLAKLRSRFGNRIAFSLALLWAAAGSALAALSINNGSFGGFCVGCFMMGNNMASIAQYRFAVNDLVPPRLISRAISAIMVGTLASAVIAPWMALQYRGLLEVDFAGSYGVLIGVYLTTFILMSFLPLDRYSSSLPFADAEPATRSFSNPDVQLAMVAAAAGYGVMSLIMTATPISMHVVNQLSAEVTAGTIRGHILAMFAPSLFSGWLIAKLGIRRMLWFGLLLEIVCVLIAVNGEQEWNYRAALVALGVGWNFLFIGGTTLLSLSCDPRDAARVQGINDMVIFGTMAIASLAAGVLLQTTGWAWTNVAAVILLTLIGAMLIRTRQR